MRRSEVRVTDRYYREKVRAAYLALNPLCVNCLRRGLTVAAAHVDHIKPRKDGGAVADFRNLQGLCVECHKAKSRWEGGRGRGRGVRVDRRRRGITLDGRLA